MGNDVPLVVAEGLMSQEDWDRLTYYHKIGDSETWAALARHLVKGNIPLFNTFVLGYDHTEHMVDVFNAMKEYEGVLIEFSRDHSKSYTIIGEVIHDICFSTVPGSGYEDPRILLLQETDKVAVKTVTAVRNILESGGPNGMIRALFGDFKGRAALWKENMLWLGSTDVSKDPTLEGVGVGSAITGGHPKKVIGDDMVSKKNSRTAHMRKVIVDWWFETVHGMLSPGTKVRILFTPYYEDDLHGVLKKSGDYMHVFKPALNRIPTKEDYREIIDDNGVRVGVEITEAGKSLKALWPCPLGTGNCPQTGDHYEEYGTHRSVEYLIHRKFIPRPSSFMSQFMLRLLDDSETRIKKDMLRFYTTNRDLVGESNEYNDSLIVPFPESEDIVCVTHGWDHAIGKRRQHDRTAHARAFRTKDNDVFFKVRAGRWGFRKVVQDMQTQFLTEEASTGHRPRALGTEGIGFQEAYSQMVLEEGQQLLPLEVVKGGNKDKDELLVESGLLSHFTHGKVYVDIEDTELIEELLSFTPEGKTHDDRVDAMRIAFNLVKLHHRRRGGFRKSSRSTGPVVNIAGRDAVREARWAKRNSRSRVARTRRQL